MAVDVTADTEQSFGANLRRARVAAGMTQGELGLGHYSRSYISLLESGARQPTADVIAHLAERLSLDPADMSQWVSRPQAQGELALAALQLEALARMAKHNQAEASDLIAVLESADLAPESPLADARRAFATVFSDQSDVSTPEMLAAMEELIGHRVVRSSPRLYGTVAEWRCFYLRGAGELDACVRAARAAEQWLLDHDAPSESLLNAYLPWSAALAELGRRQEAIDLIPALERSLAVCESKIDEGRGRWALGNLLLMAGAPDRAIVEHECAATLINPARYLRLWARLHRSVAAVRVEHGIALETVPYHIERADVAFSISAAPTDVLELDAVRAVYALARADFDAAVIIARQVLRSPAGLPAQSLASVEQTLGAALVSLGQAGPGRDHLAEAVRLFRSVGAFERALAVCAEWEIAPPRDSE